MFFKNNISKDTVPFNQDEEENFYFQIYAEIMLSYIWCLYCKLRTYDLQEKFKSHRFFEIFYSPLIICLLRTLYGLDIKVKDYFLSEKLPYRISVRALIPKDTTGSSPMVPYLHNRRIGSNLIWHTCMSKYVRNFSDFTRLKISTYRLFKKKESGRYFSKYKTIYSKMYF